MKSVLEKIKSSSYLKLLLFFTSFVWFTKFSGVILPLHLIKSGLSFVDFSIGASLSVLAQIITVLLISRTKLKNIHLWILSALLYLTVFTIYVTFPSTIIYFIGALLSGVASVIFYGPYNVSHFELTPRNKTGSGAALFFNLLTGVGIIAPIAAGTVASFSIFILLLISFILAFIAVSFMFFQEKIDINFSVKESFKEISKVKWIIYLRGIHEALGTFITLVTITLIYEFFDLGVYGTVLAVLGILISFAVGKYSDRLSTKKHLLAPLAIINGVLTLLFIFDVFRVNIILWGLLNLVWGKIDGLFDQTALAFVMDETKDRLKTTFGREIVLNIGRLTGTLVVVLGFAIPNFIDYSIAILASSMFMYAIYVTCIYHNLEE
ncbi:MAG: hypothetical protein MRY49_00170 [Candidatus Pacebacteria bacterium]|nr:hypothetical protein [Candidatus Paceibacterota bacterium]